MRIVWLEDARDDLESIYRFVAQDSEKAAAEIHNNIYDQAGKLKDFPWLGVVDPLLNENAEVYRSLIVRRHYKVVYKIDDKFIYIIAIWDCRQNPKMLMAKVNKN